MLYGQGSQDQSGRGTQGHCRPGPTFHNHKADQKSAVLGGMCWISPSWICPLFTLNWKISLGTQISYALSNQLGVITYSLHWRKTSAHPHPSVLIFLCNWYVLILEWVCILEALSSVVQDSTSNPVTIWPDYKKMGAGEQQAVGPLHEQSCWALTCFNLQRARASLPCAQAHRSVRQVKGESAGTWEQKGCPLSPVEAIHHVAFFCSCMGQLPPCRIFSFSCLSQEYLMLSFQSYFLLSPECTFWMLWGQSHFGLFWSVLIVVGGGMQTRDHLGWSLTSCPQENGGALKSGLWVQRHAMLSKMPCQEK